MTDDSTLRETIRDIMSDRQSRSAKWIIHELNKRGYDTTPVKVSRICKTIPEIEIIGKWCKRAEYRMVD